MSASTEKKNRQAAREAGTDKKLLAAQEEAAKAAKSKRRWTLGTIGVILLIAVIVLLNSGLLYQTTAYSVGDTNYSAAEVSYQYGSQYNYLLNQYGSYASMLGLDTSTGLAGLKDSKCTLGEGTWRDYFIRSAEDYLLQMTALADYAAANDIALSEEELAAVDASFEGMDEYAKAQGYASADNLFAANYGAGVSMKTATEAARVSSLASKALTSYSDSLQYTQEQLKEEYAGYNGEQDVFDFLYYYVAAATSETTDDQGNASTQVTDEALAEAKSIAQAIETGYKAGEGEDYLERLNAAIAAEVPDASATEQTGMTGSGLSDYKEWMMSASRSAGDIAVTEQGSGSGYYVTVFQSRSANDYPTVSMRHILVKAVADEDGSYSDEAKAEAKAKAEALLDEWKAGEQTEESFALLAAANSEDTGSNTNGGLYENIYKNRMVDGVNAFCFGERKPGDTAVVYGESGSYAGYHVIYFVGEGENYCDYIARTNLSNSDLETFLTDLEAGYTTAEGFGMRLVG